MIFWLNLLVVVQLLGSADNTDGHIISFTDGKVGGRLVQQEGWHFSFERGCAREGHGKAGLFFSRATENGPAFVNVLCAQTSTQRIAGPLGATDLAVLEVQLQSPAADLAPL